MTGARRLTEVAAVLATAAVAVDTWRLARRWRSVPVLPLSVPSTVEGTADAGEGWLVVHADDVTFDRGVRDAAVAHARQRQLTALELVPGDVPAGRLLDAARRADRRRLAVDPLAPAVAAGWAVVVRGDLARRLGIAAGPADARAVAAAALAARSGSFGAYDLAVVPGWCSAGAPTARPAGQWAALHGRWAPVAVTVRLGAWVLATAGLVGARRPGCRRSVGAGPLLAAWLAPWVVAGSGRPPRGSLVRPVAEPGAAASALAALRTELGGPDPWADRRAEYDELLAGDPRRWFQPRRDRCPWCGGGSLEPMVSSPDRVQGKPGRFVLERCADCGLVFQNPQLTDAGLSLAYRDFYDGIGAEQIAGVFASLGVHYRRRAAMLRGHAEPASWLDVGTGHGHFCAVARTLWPGTRFDGLDQGAGVEEAARRGWVDRAVRGSLVELAAEPSHSYDVVSMCHYLEHTPDPAEQLDAAAALVAPGGHLLVEVPNPECRWGRLLGSWWMPWFQPQHLNLLPAAALRQALVDRGFQVVASELVGPHQPAELMFAALFAAEALAPDPRLPWHGPPTRLRRTTRGAVMAAAMPVLAAGAVADRVAAAVLRTPSWSNAYRLLARKAP